MCILEFLLNSLKIIINIIQTYICKHVNLELFKITLENALSVLLKSLAGFKDAKNPEVDLKFELEKRVLDDDELTPTARDAEVLPA